MLSQLSRSLIPYMKSQKMSLIYYRSHRDSTNTEFKKNTAFFICAAGEHIYNQLVSMLASLLYCVLSIQGGGGFQILGTPSRANAPVVAAVDSHSCSIQDGSQSHLNLATRAYISQLCCSNMEPRSFFGVITMRSDNSLTITPVRTIRVAPNKFLLTGCYLYEDESGSICAVN